VHAREIVGVAGLLGSGSEDLPYALFGALPEVSGSLRCGGWSGDVADLTPRTAQRIGLALVPGDRKQQGGASGLSVEKNMLLLVVGRYMRHGVLSLPAIRRTATERSENLRRPSPPAGGRAGRA
jgi:ribose transport system ATP-binding protein